MAKRGFESVVLKQETTVKGGLMSKPCSLPTLMVKIGDSNMEFVQLHKRQDWMCKMVTGQGSWERPLKRVKLLDALQRKIRSAMGGEDEEADGVGSDGEDDVSKIDDPMASLAFGGEYLDQPKEKPKKSKRLLVRKDVLLRLQMPEEPPEKNPACRQMREVRAWIANPKAVWLSIEDLPWAIAFTHDQYSLGGVSTVVDEEVASASPAKSKNVRWDFKADCWVATVETGSSKKERRIKPSALRFREAAAFVEPNVDLSTMGYEEKKRIAYEALHAWLELHEVDPNHD